MVWQIGRQEPFLFNKEAKIRKQNAVIGFNHFQQSVRSQSINDANVGQFHLSVHTHIGGRCDLCRVGEGMETTDEDPQTIGQGWGQGSIAKLQRTLRRNAEPGPFRGGGSVSSRKEAIGHQQITMQTHLQISIAGSTGEGGPRAERQCLEISVGVHLAVPTAKEFDRDPTRINHGTRVTDRNGRAVRALNRQHLILLELYQLVPGWRGRLRLPHQCRQQHRQGRRGAGRCAHPPGHTGPEQT